MGLTHSVLSIAAFFGPLFEEALPPQQRGPVGAETGDGAGVGIFFFARSWSWSWSRVSVHMVNGLAGHCYCYPAGFPSLHTVGAIFSS
ncbi:hypothetical protein ACLKA7_015210 [Drosophila subpalustris]